MGMVLGYDGKRWALNAGMGEVTTPFPTLYLGVLETMPADPDSVQFSVLDTNEFASTADFYTAGRQVITFDMPVVDGANGRYQLNNNVITIPNANADRAIAGVFITTVQSGPAGQSLWVGTPDLGSYNVGAGNPLTIPVGGILCGID